MLFSKLAGYSGAEIRDYLFAKGFVDFSGKALDPGAIYLAAQEYKVSGAELDTAMGWPAGTANQWVRDQGLQALNASDPVFTKLPRYPMPPEYVPPELSFGVPVSLPPAPVLVPGSGTPANGPPPVLVTAPGSTPAPNTNGMSVVQAPFPVINASGVDMTSPASLSSIEPSTIKLALGALALFSFLR